MHYAMALVALTGSMALTSASAAGDCAAISGATVQPLVELYTSEGCSSCPPAERWLSQRISESDANYLAFHVDYWDYIGWKDRFASPEHSQRQYRRVASQGGRTVYTPQVMVGEAVQAPWQKPDAWSRTLQVTRRAAAAALALRLVRSESEVQVVVEASPTGADRGTAQVWLARYVDAQTTVVRAGENRGATLRHDRVVRKLWGPWPLDRSRLSRRIALPGETAPWGLTAVVEDPSGEILQSLSLRGSDCAAAPVR